MHVQRPRELAGARIADAADRMRYTLRRRDHWIDGQWLRSTGMHHARLLSRSAPAGTRARNIS